MELVGGVNPSGPSVQPMGGLQCAINVLREDGGGKTIVGIVGLTYDVVVIFELDHYANRPEDLLLNNPHAWVSVREDGRLHEEAVPVKRLSTAVDCSAFFLTNVDVVEHALKKSFEYTSDSRIKSTTRTSYCTLETRAPRSDSSSKGSPTRIRLVFSVNF